MPIDLDIALGAELPGATFSWSDEDIVLYNLAVGCGIPPDEPGELKYTYEGAGLVAVPTFGTIPPFSIMMSLGAVDGIDVDLARILQGHQRLTIHRPVPTSGTVTQSGRVVGVYDRGRGALLVLEVLSSLVGTGQALFTNQSGIYVRGEGGFGGDRGPVVGIRAPDREPDQVVESPTLPQQALLYRMASGDKNPLHADPAFAALAGFDRPILHGLCTYGIVLHAVVESSLGGEAESVTAYEARFTGHVFPGETLVTSIWAEGDRYIISTVTEERGTTVLGNGALEVDR
ncbi:MAG: MaoC/PaaZ C-terminal domain-containing protein [Acidimicrobiia bacterium]